MSNDFYSHGSTPVAGSTGSSSTIRAEFDSVMAGFDKMPALTGNANKAVYVNASGTGLEARTVSGATTASSVSFTPTGTIASTDAQSAIAEAASEACQKSSNLSDVANAATALSNLGGIGAATTNTLTNKSLVDASTFIVDDGDNTKKLAFQVSGVTTGTTRTVTVPDASGTLMLQGAVTTSGLTQSTARILGRTTAAAGAIEEISVGAGLTFSGGVLDTAAAGSSMPTGVTMDYVGTTAPTGWVLLSGRTIGSATSGATERANADTQTLFELLWNSMANTEAAVSGGRGANATADFTANKTIALPDARGRVIVGKDNMGGTTASRVTAGGSGVTGTTLGASGGAETVALTIAQMAAHTHSFPTTTDSANAGGSNLFSDSIILGGSTITSSSQGSGAAHNNTQPSLVLNKIIKL